MGFRRCARRSRLRALDESVHFTVQRDVFYDFAAIDLERGAEVVDVHTGKLAHHPICDSRRQAAEQKIVHTLFPPTANDIGMSGFESREQLGNVRGIVLKVSVHGDDDIAGSKIEAAASAVVCP